MIECVRGFVEPVGFQRGSHFADAAMQTAEDPPVRDRPIGDRRVCPGPVQVHQDEAGGVPQLVREVPIAFDPLLRELDVPAGRGHRGQGKAQGVGPVLVHHFQRIDHVALGLAHLLTFGVPHERMNVDVPERLSSHELQAHHNHPRDPEEEDVEASH